MLSNWNRNAFVICFFFIATFVLFRYGYVEVGQEDKTHQPTLHKQVNTNTGTLEDHLLCLPVSPVDKTF